MVTTIPLFFQSGLLPHLWLVGRAHPRHKSVKMPAHGVEGVEITGVGGMGPVKSPDSSMCRKMDSRAGSLRSAGSSLTWWIASFEKFSETISCHLSVFAPSASLFQGCQRVWTGSRRERKIPRGFDSRDCHCERDNWLERRNAFRSNRAARRNARSGSSREA